MKVLVVFAVCSAFASFCKRFILRYPVALYAAAALLDILCIVGRDVSLPSEIAFFSNVVVRPCALALAFFSIVMYIGIFSRTSKIRNHLAPMRKELSIAACILTVGHVAFFLPDYAARSFGSPAAASLAAIASSMLGVLLVVLSAILGMTSLDWVKRRMSAMQWKRVQRLAYPFFLFIYVHVLLLLLPAAMQGGRAAQISVASYTLLFGFYGLARLLALMHQTTSGEVGLRECDFEVQSTR